MNLQATALLALAASACGAREAPAAGAAASASGGLPTEVQAFFAPRQPCDQCIAGLVFSRTARVLHGQDGDAAGDEILGFVDAGHGCSESLALSSRRSAQASRLADGLRSR